ncbi:MAG: hypothetical protein RL318_2200 [Fibrobacterota bacterium]|jgi:ATP-binding protein involved in chromosome partitioning
MLNQEMILQALKVVMDPDLHKDIVTLGFIQNIRIDGGKVDFDLVLTTPACPVKDKLRDEAEAAVRTLAGVESVEVRLWPTRPSSHAMWTRRTSSPESRM